MDKDKRTYIVLGQNGSERDDYSMDDNLAASLSIALALRKFTNESPSAQRDQKNDSILWEYTKEIKGAIYDLALQYKIIAPNNSESNHIQYNLMRCFHIPHKKDEALLRLCNLLIFLHSKKSVFVDGFGKIETTEKALIENAILQQFFESLNVSHKIEDYARLITWSSPNPPKELEIKQACNGSIIDYVYTDNNPRPLSISLESLEYIKQAEELPFHKKGKEYTATIYAHQKLKYYGFINYNNRILTGQAAFIYDVLQYLGYFKNEPTIRQRQCDKNKAKRNKIIDIIY